MSFRGKVTDRDGNPLVGANITTVLRRPQTNRLAGTITDFNGVFTISDIRPEETWRVTYVGFEEVLFKMPRFGGERNFVLEEDVTQLEGVTVSPRNPVVRTPRFNPNEDLLPSDPSGISDSFRNLINDLPTQQPTKKSLWDTLKENPLIALSVGLVAALGVGYVVSQVARQSDKQSQKQLANA